MVESHEEISQRTTKKILSKVLFSAKIEENLISIFNNPTVM